MGIDGARCTGELFATKFFERAGGFGAQRSAGVSASAGICCAAGGLPGMGAAGGMHLFRFCDALGRRGFPSAGGVLRWLADCPAGQSAL